MTAIKRCGQDLGCRMRMQGESLDGLFKAYEWPEKRGKTHLHGLLRGTDGLKAQF